MSNNEKSDAIVTPEWQHLKAKAIEWKSGQIFSHQELCEMMSIPNVCQKYYNSMRKALRELVEVGVLLSNIKNVGYKVLTPNEWLTEAKNKMQRGAIQDSQRIINNAPYLQMSEQVKNESLQFHQMLIKQKQLLSSELKNAR